MSARLPLVSHSAGTDLADEVGHERTVRPVFARAEATQRLGLSDADLVAATGVTGGLPDELIAPMLEAIKSVASALADESDRDAARIRLVSRQIALSKAQLDVLVAQIGECMRAGDHAGARRADALANSAMKRMSLMLAEHRAACQSTRPTFVAVANAGVVKVAR